MRKAWPLVAALIVTAAAHAATPPSLELRRVVACGTGDHALTLVGSDEQLCLGKDKLLDGADVVKVERYPGLPKAVIEITDAAADRLHEATSIGSDDERLGFVFNGKLIFAPYVGGPLKLKQLPLSLKNDPDDVDALVAAFPGAVAAR
jgi:hypothetical protein